MASNKEFIEKILEIDPEAKTDGLKNHQLADFLRALQVEQAEGDQGDQGDAAPAPVVAKGRAITSKRGILKEGVEVKAEYLAGGQIALEALIKAGSVEVK